MIITKLALPRRTFLRGLGATLALPVLDAMVPAFGGLSAAAAPVRRLGVVYIPMGSNIAEWMPKQEGTLTELSPTLAPLMPFLKHVNVLSNLEMKNAYSSGNHATANCTFLSGVKAKMTEGSDYEMGVTVDQIAAQQLGKETALPSLELATDFNYVVGNCDNGFNCVYMNTLAWSSKTTPLPTEANPRVVFERLFGDGGSAADRKAELRKNGSILDWVTEDMARLGRRLGPSDRTRVDEYLDTLREVERRIQKAEQQDGDALPVGADAAGWRAVRLGRAREAHVRSAGARAAGRHHARHHVPAGARSEHADVSADWRGRAASRDVASPELAGEAREAGQDQHLSRVAVRVSPREAPGHERRRRDAPGSFDVRARQRPRQSGRARSYEPADRRRGRRIADEGRPAHQVRASRRRWRTSMPRCSTRWACRPSGLPTATARSTSCSSRCRCRSG